MKVKPLLACAYMIVIILVAFALVMLARSTG